MNSLNQKICFNLLHLLIILSLIQSSTSVSSSLYICGAITYTDNELESLQIGNVSTIQKDKSDILHCLNILRYDPPSQTFNLTLYHGLVGDKENGDHFCAVYVGDSPITDSQFGNCLQLFDPNVARNGIRLVNVGASDPFLNMIKPQPSAMRFVFINIGEFGNFFSDNSIAISQSPSSFTDLFIELEGTLPAHIPRDTFVNLTSLSTFHITMQDCKYNKHNINIVQQPHVSGEKIPQLWFNPTLISQNLTSLSFLCPCASTSGFNLHAIQQLNDLALSFRNLGAFLGNSSNISSLEQALEGLNTSKLSVLYLCMASSADRKFLHHLPHGFFNATGGGSGAGQLQLVINYWSKIPMVSRKMMPPWTAGLPQSLLLLDMDFFIVHTKLLEDLERVRYSGRLPAGLILNFRHALWWGNSFSLAFNVKHGMYLASVLEMSLVDPLDHTYAVKKYVKEAFQNNSNWFVADVSSLTTSNEISVSCLPAAGKKNATASLGRSELRVVLGNLSNLTRLFSVDSCAVQSKDIFSLNTTKVNIVALSKADLTKEMIQFFLPCAFKNDTEGKTCCKTIEQSAITNLTLVGRSSFTIGDRIEVLTDRVLCNMRQLFSLSLVNARITAVEQEFISSFKNLYFLDLSHNYLTELPSRLLSHVSNHVPFTFRASHNQITSLSPDGICSNLTVESFDVSHNLLTSFNWTAQFSKHGCTSFPAVLNLSNNSISELDVDMDPSFFDLPYVSVYEVDVSLNQLTSLSVRGLPDYNAVKKLMAVNASSNKLATLSSVYVSNVPQLFSLDLSNNDMSEVHDMDGYEATVWDSCTLYGCVIDLSGNHFSTNLNVSSFFFNVSILSLDLRDNHIESFPGDVVRVPFVKPLHPLQSDMELLSWKLLKQNWNPKLVPPSSFYVTIRLSNNSIRSLTDKALCRGQDWNVYYDLSNVGMEYVYPTTFSCSHIDSVLMINLNRNHLSCIPLSEEGVGPGTVRLLSLRETNVTTLPCKMKNSFQTLNSLALNTYDLSEPSLSVQNLFECCGLMDITTGSIKAPEEAIDPDSLKGKMTKNLLDLSKDSINVDHMLQMESFDSGTICKYHNGSSYVLTSIGFFRKNDTLVGACTTTCSSDVCSGSLLFREEFRPTVLVTCLFAILGLYILCILLTILHSFFVSEGSLYSGYPLHFGNGSDTERSVPFPETAFSMHANAFLCDHNYYNESDASHVSYTYSTEHSPEASVLPQSEHGSGANLSEEQAAVPLRTQTLDSYYEPYVYYSLKVSRWHAEPQVPSDEEESLAEITLTKYTISTE